MLVIHRNGEFELTTIQSQNKSRVKKTPELFQDFFSLKVDCITKEGENYKSEQTH